MHSHFYLYFVFAGNSIKFTAEGEVIVTAKVKSRAGDNIELLFSVRDTGNGSFFLNILQAAVLVALIANIVLS